MALDKETDKKELLVLINSNASLQSLLYDLNLLPECCMGSVEEWKMWNIASHFRIESTKQYALGVADERERCAKICESDLDGIGIIAIECAEAIRKGE